MNFAPRSALYVKLLVDSALVVLLEAGGVGDELAGLVHGGLIGEVLVVDGALGVAAWEAGGGGCGYGGVESIMPLIAIPLHPLDLLVPLKLVRAL